MSSNYKQQKCLIMTAICCCGTCRWEVSKEWQYLTCFTSKERLSKLKSSILLYLYKLITSCPCKKSGILFQYAAQYRNSIKMDKWMLCNIKIWRKRCFLLYFYTLNNSIKLCVVLRTLNLSWWNGASFNFFKFIDQ